MAIGLGIEVLPRCGFFNRRSQVRLLGDEKRGMRYDVAMECRKLGQDNRKDQLVNISDYFVQIGDYLRAVTRKPTNEELLKLLQIAGSI